MNVFDDSAHCGHPCSRKLRGMEGGEGFAIAI